MLRALIAALDRLTKAIDDQTALHRHIFNENLATAAKADSYQRSAEEWRDEQRAHMKVCERRFRERDSLADPDAPLLH